MRWNTRWADVRPAASTSCRSCAAGRDTVRVLAARCWCGGCGARPPRCGWVRGVHHEQPAHAVGEQGVEVVVAGIQFEQGDGDAHDDACGNEGLAHAEDPGARGGGQSGEHALGEGFVQIRERPGRQRAEPGGDDEPAGMLAPQTQVQREDAVDALSCRTSRESAQLGDTLLERGAHDGLDELLLGGEVAVEGVARYVGFVGDLVEAHAFDALGGEAAGSDAQDALALTGAASCDAGRGAGCVHTGSLTLSDDKCQT